MSTCGRFQTAGPWKLNEIDLFLINVSAFHYSYLTGKIFFFSLKIFPHLISPFHNGNFLGFIWLTLASLLSEYLAPLEIKFHPSYFSPQNSGNPSFPMPRINYNPSPLESWLDLHFSCTCNLDVTFSNFSFGIFSPWLEALWWNLLPVDATHSKSLSGYCSSFYRSMKFRGERVNN